MADRRDDMVIVPRLTRGEEHATRTEARRERTARHLRNRKGVVGRVARGAAVRKVRRAGFLHRAVSPRVLATGAVTGAAVATGLMLAKGISGRTIENMGENLKEFLIGDLDERSRANMDVRNQFMGDRVIVNVAARTDADNRQIREMFETLRDIRETQLRGVNRIMADKQFQVRSTLDIILENFSEYLQRKMQGLIMHFMD